MRVVQLDFEDPEFPARLVERPDPELPGPAWALIEVIGGGVCGSDLHLFKPTTGATLALYSYGTLPMELGHEIAGVVTEAGPECPWTPGARVAVDPVLGCLARGIDPPCERCLRGAASLCRSIGGGEITAGMGLGFTSGLGAGWGDRLVAHASQLHEIPTGVPARAETLPEPLSIAVHGLLRTPPVEGPILVIGAGIIGLLTTVALRALFPDLEVVVVAKYAHQATAAAACGAHHVIKLDDEPWPALAAAASTSIRGGGGNVMLAGGFPYVVEAVGSEAAVSQALRSVDSRGTLILLGASGLSEVDLSPIWFKEATVTGSFCHAHDQRPGAGASSHSFATAIELLASGAAPADALVTHEFALDDWRAGLDAGMARELGAIKVVFRP